MVKAKLSLCLTKHHNMKMYLIQLSTTSLRHIGGVEVQLHAFLTSALGRGEWSVSCPGHFTPGLKALSTHMTGGWVGPSAGVDAVAKR
jgi:hypothetical protein